MFNLKSIFVYICALVILLLMIIVLHKIGLPPNLNILVCATGYGIFLAYYFKHVTYISLFLLFFYFIIWLGSLNNKVFMMGTINFIAYFSTLAFRNYKELWAINPLKRYFDNETTQ